MTSETTEKLIADFSKRSILIVGDVMLDDYISGDVTRISPEAPVPILNITSRYACLGGAANVALNIKSLGATPVLCSVIGKEQKSDDFLTIMQQQNLSVRGICQSKDRILTTKYRALGNKMQLLRLDNEVTHPLSPKDEQNLSETITSIIHSQRIDAIIVEDYDKGVVTPLLIRELLALANQKSIPLTVDPKKRNFSSYQGTTLFKPNWKEFKEGTQLEINAWNDPALPDAIRRFMSEKQHKNILLTLSDNGMLICQNEPLFTCTHIPSCERKVADVSGAGDTVISVATLCLSSGLEIKNMAELANLAGGLACEEAGVTAIDKERFIKEINKYYHENKNDLY
ncbi:MAG: PfkB family carbohydrate kinase [Bacteroidales bacterium]|nr:PfkB family carbohydrate kinase [Bacteroidales bacterium]